MKRKLFILLFCISGFTSNSQIAFYQKNFLWGVLDNNGKETTPPIYSQWKPIFKKNKSYAVCKDEKWGIINSQGKIVVEPKYDFIDWDEGYNDGIALVCMGGQVQFFSYKGLYSKGGLWGAINENGKEIIPVKYNQLNSYNGIIIANLGGVQENEFNNWIDNGTFGAFNLNGKCIVPMKYAWINCYKGILSANMYKNYTAYIQNDYYNSQGDSLINKKYKKIIQIGTDAFKVYDGVHWGAINFKQDIIVPVIYDDIGSEECNGNILVNKGSYSYPNGNTGKGLWGVYKIGQGEIEKCDESEVNYYFHRYDFDKCRRSKPFCVTQGCCGVQKQGNKFVYLDSSCVMKIQAKFDTLTEFSQGIAIAKLDGNWILIDTKGNKLATIKENISRAKQFANGFAQISISGEKNIFGSYQNEKWGFIDSKGKIIISPSFLEVKDFNNGFAAARVPAKGEIENDTKWVLINENGKILTKSYYDEIAY